MSSVPGPGPQPSQGKREGVSQGLQQKTGSVYVQVFSDSQDKGRGPVCTPRSQPTAPPSVPSLDMTPAAITSSLRRAGGGVGGRKSRDGSGGSLQVPCAPPLPPARPLPAPHRDHPVPKVRLWALGHGLVPTRITRNRPRSGVSLLFSAPQSSALSLARASLTADGGSGEDAAPKGPSAPVPLQFSLASVCLRLE